MQQRSLWVARLVEKRNKKQQPKHEFLTHKTHTASQSNELYLLPWKHVSVWDAQLQYSSTLFHMLRSWGEAKPHVWWNKPVVHAWQQKAASGAGLGARPWVYLAAGGRCILSPGYTCCQLLMSKPLCNIRLYTDRNMLNWERNQSQCLSAALGHVTIKKQACDLCLAAEISLPVFTLPMNTWNGWPGVYQHFSRATLPVELRHIPAGQHHASLHTCFLACACFRVSHQSLKGTSGCNGRELLPLLLLKQSFVCCSIYHL